MKNVLTVSQLNRYIKGVFEDEIILSHVMVSGEAMGITLRAGAAYFSLRDEECTISCVWFKPNPNLLPKEGEAIIAEGTPQYYTKSGKITFIVANVTAQGEGGIAKKHQLLKQRLMSEGIFSNKKPMPSSIKRIGVVTSGTGAVIHDIISVVRRRQPSASLVLHSVRVQGEGAENEIANAITLFSKRVCVDALIIARGGGSLEDLEAFNHEQVARAVAACTRFTVSAVGHETDTTLCDFAADLRAATPTAAAELLTYDERSIILATYNLAKRLDRAFNTQLYLKANKIKEKSSRLDFLSNQLIIRAKTDIKHKARVLSKDALAHALQARNRALHHKNKLCNALEKTLNAKTQTISLKAQLLEGVNPMRILKSGYARVFYNNEPVLSVAGLKEGESISVAMADGRANARIEEIIKKESL